MLKWGYNTNGFGHHRLGDALEILGELGYRSVAITLDIYSLNPFAKSLQQEIQQVRTILDQFRMESVIETGARFLLDPRRKHQPTLLGNESEVCKRLDFLERSIQIASQLGSRAVSFWSGSRVPDQSQEKQLAQLVPHCRYLAETASRENVRLAFEPEPGMLIDTMQAFEHLHNQVNHECFGLTLDLGHLHCLGELPVESHIHRWRDRLWNIHIEDMRAGVHDHLFFGEGEMNFGPILSTLKEIDYREGIHVELSRHSHNAFEVAKKSIEFLQRMESKGNS